MLVLIKLIHFKRMKKSRKNPNSTRKEWAVIICKGGIIAVLVIMMAACSIESKLNRKYLGKSFTEVVEVMGAPTTIDNRVGGGTFRSYVKKIMLRETPINTGAFRYDKFDSPKALKTEITEFTVNPAGKVTAIRYSCEYTK